MISAAHGSYNKAELAVQKKEDILLLLLDNAAMALKRIRTAIKDNRPQAKGENISRAVFILSELDCALDHEIDKELTDNLSHLYQFIMDRLTRVNLQNDLTALNEADRVLDDLHDGFKEAVNSFKAEGLGAALQKSMRNEGKEHPEAPKTLSIEV